MAKAFTQLKNPKLVPVSKLDFGKYNGCRLCDVWDDYEYFIWLHNKNPHRFSQACVDKFYAFRDRVDRERHQREEVDPYLTQDFDDVPF